MKNTSISTVKESAGRMLDFFDRRFDLIESLFNGVGGFSLANDIVRDNLYGTEIPYDIIQTDNGYAVEMALAGFSKDEIKISVKDEKFLCVSAKKSTKSEEKRSGKLSFSSKEVKFSLPKKFSIENVKYVDGILRLEINIPREDESKKDSERLIPIE